MSTNMTIHLRYWRQSGPTTMGYLEDRTLSNVNEHMSFLEMLTCQRRIARRKIHWITIAIGACGSCNLVINGQVHGLKKGRLVVSYT